MNVHHTTIYVSDIVTSTAFYDAVFAALGLQKTIDTTYDGMHCVAYGTDAQNQYWIVEASKEEPATTRFHIAFMADTTPIVDAFHHAGCAAGGTDNGAPGLRPHYAENYYGAFVKDPDGNNIEAVCFV